MIENNPLVSIIVPIYNSEKYLTRCLDSILLQTYHNWELILVDDGSSDESGLICNSYVIRDKRIIYIYKTNGGLSSARETGFKAMHGSYAMFVDSDDWLDPKTLQHCIKVLNEYSVECVCFSYIREYQRRSLPVHIFDGSKYFSSENISTFYRRFWGLYENELKHPERGDSIVSCCMKLYSYDLLKNAKFFDTNRIGGSEDTLFNIYALRYCSKVFYLDMPMYHYNKMNNGTTLSSSYRPHLQEKYNELFFEFFRAKVQLNVDDECVQSLYNRICLTPIGIGLNELSNPNRKERIDRIKQYINSDFYKESYRKAQTKFLPFIWRIFFYCAGHGLSLILYIMLSGLKFLKSRK